MMGTFGFPWCACGMTWFLRHGHRVHNLTFDLTFTARFFPTPVGTPGGKPLRLTARVKIARARPDRFWPAEPFFRITFVIRPPQIASSSFTPSIACSVSTLRHPLRLIHSHSESTHAFAPPRGVATRRFRQPIADIGHVKGWLHWRLLGALTKGDARAAYSRRIVAPSSSLRPLFFSTRAAPAPLCCAWAIESHPINHSLISPVPPHRSTTSSRPPRNGLAVLRKENGSGG